MALMTFGPFDIPTFKSLVETLQRLDIPFEAIQDDQALADWNLNAEADIKMSASTPAYLHVEMEDEHVRAHLDELSRFGLSLETVEEPDFSVEDYLCPKCRHHATEPGLCPRHHEPLLPYEQFVEKSGRPDTLQYGIVGIAVLVLGALGYLFLRNSG